MMITEMIQKRAKVWDAAKSFVDTHENENGVLSAEDNATYEKMEKEIEDLTAAIDRQQRAEAREAALNQPMNKKYAPVAPEKSVPFLVKVSAMDLNIRVGPGTQYARTGKYTGIGVFTIVEEKNGWGRLKSGAGWISLSYAKRI